MQGEIQPCAIRLTRREIQWATKVIIHSLNFFIRDGALAHLYTGNMINDSAGTWILILIFPNVLLCHITRKRFYVLNSKTMVQSLKQRQVNH